MDNQPLAATYSEGIFKAQATGLSASLHQVIIEAVDFAGNSSTASFGFRVDLSPPLLANPLPKGAISSRTPLLRIAATDAGAGINSSAISMILSYGPLHSKLPATYDAVSGVVSYQVPSRVKGIGLGHFPLIDGKYRVVVHVSDLVGQTTAANWTFVVKSLP